MKHIMELIKHNAFSTEKSSKMKPNQHTIPPAQRHVSEEEEKPPNVLNGKWNSILEEKSINKIISNIKSKK